MNNARSFAIAAFALVLIAMSARTGWASITPQAGRELLAKSAPAIASVRVTSEMVMTIEGREDTPEEEDIELAGCVVHPSGLIVTSLTGMDSATLYQDLWSRFETVDFKFRSDIRDVKVRLDDGSEFQGEVALRDRDLDIALIRPRAPLEKPVTALALSDPAGLEILDPVLLVGRAGRQLHWTPTAHVSAVTGVLTRPRRMYLLPGSEDWSLAPGLLGGAAFSAEGKLAGVVVIRRLQPIGKEPAESIFVILPAREIQPVLSQVLKD